MFGVKNHRQDRHIAHVAAGHLDRQKIYPHNEKEMWNSNPMEVADVTEEAGELYWRSPATPRQLLLFWNS